MFFVQRFQIRVSHNRNSIHPTSLKSNFISDNNKFLPLSLESLIDRDFEEYDKKKKAAEEIATSTSVEEKSADGIVTTTTTTITTTKVETIVVNKTAATTTKDSSPDLVVDKPAAVDVSAETDTSIDTIPTPVAPNIDSNTPPDSTSVVNEGHARENAPRGYNYGETTDTKKEEEKGKVTIPHDDSNSIYVGLRVYTHKDVPAVVVGRLKGNKV